MGRLGQERGTGLVWTGLIGYFTEPMAAMSDPKKANSIYEYSAVDIDGNEVSLENYKQLVDMYQRYSEAAGLRILGFPCNQFGGQEPGTEAEIKEFAKGKYNVAFDMFSKINVNGGDTHPLWAYLKD